MAAPRMPRLILMCGLPGAGKTTLARRLTNDVRAVRLCPDEWMADLGINLFEEETRERLEQVFWRLAQDLLRQGQSVILESGFWLRADRDEKRLGARALGVAVELRYLDVPMEELWRRVERRNGAGERGSVPISREQLALYATFFEAPEPAELELFDPPPEQREM